MSAMTFNIRYNNPNDGVHQWSERKEELTQLIEFYHPDFLGIQEGLDGQVHYILEHTSHYQWIGVGRDDGKKAGEYSALFYDSTKFHLIEERTFWLSDTPEVISKGWDAALPRICTYGIFENIRTNEKIYVFNAHFDHIGSLARKNSAELIVNHIKTITDEGSKLILMGDFNALPTEDPILIFKRDLDWAGDHSDLPLYGPISTFIGFDKEPVTDRMIDFIFTKNLNIKKYRHVDDRRKNNLPISDHIPVLIEFD
jgi:endonuclease/exonuclease/phosphatase family metal-dependent hydrolase